MRVLNARSLACKNIFHHDVLDSFQVKLQNSERRMFIAVQASFHWRPEMCRHLFKPDHIKELISAPEERWVRPQLCLTLCDKEFFFLSFFEKINKSNDVGRW
jgi:hypothetical protein